MKTIAYLRVAKNTQEVKNQRLAILDFAQSKKIRIDDFMEVSASSRRSLKERQVDILLSKLKSGDRLIVSELSRMGRSVDEIITTIDTLIKEGVMFESIKEGISLNGKHDLQSKVMVTLFGLFAEIERELISVRTKEGLAAARASGKVLGRPKGSFGVSRLNGREDEIRRLLSIKVSKASIAKITGVGESTLYHFLSTRDILRVV